MTWNEDERARPNVAGLASPVQQAEMKLILAGRWPPLKPLPVFKYETDEYRASIEFDKLRGEWICHKTSLASNKVQELRGGLIEITRALPHGPVEVIAECAEAEPQEQELEKDASRRRQAILEWRENYENGALYSGLQNYLSESQRDEINESIRLTLTARQLQCNPKNVAYVFDALSKAGGKPATLLEIAQRNKRRGAVVPAKSEAAAPDAERQLSFEAIRPMRERRVQMRTTPASRAHVEIGGTSGGIVLNISKTGMAVAADDALLDDLSRIRLPLPSAGQSIEISAQMVWLAESKKSAGMRFVDLTAEARNQISNWIASEKPAPELEDPIWTPVESLIPGTLESFAEESIGSVFPEQDQPFSAEMIAQTAPQASKIVTPEILGESPPSLAEDLQEKVHRHPPVAGLGPQVGRHKREPAVDRIENSRSRKYVLEISGFHVAAVVILFAMISLSVGLTVGRGPLGMRSRGTEKSIPAVDATSPALLNDPGATSSLASTPPAANTLHTPAVDPPAPEMEKSRSENPSANPEPSPERNGSTGLIARNSPPRVSPKPAHSPRAVGPTSGAPRNLAPRGITPSAVLVRGPGDGSKPFRLTLPEEPIAASSSFAMTSQLSVLVAPEPGAAVTHKAARLQPAELVSFVWPRYPKPGDRYGVSETVKVRATIGKLGQVVDVKLVSGSSSLLPAAMSAIRLWRYRPTLLNKRPVQAQQDVTIEYLPPQYSSHVTTQHASHN